MKNIFLNLFTLSLISLISLNSKSGSITLKNEVTNIVRFTVTYRLYSDNFVEEFKFIDKIENVPNDILASLKNQTLKELTNKISTGSLKLRATLENRGLLKKVKASNALIAHRKKISDEKPFTTTVVISKDASGKKFIEIPNIMWQEEVNIPLEDQYFKTNTSSEKIITSVEAHFVDDQNNSQVLKMDSDSKGWSDPCFTVKDYDKIDVTKGDIAIAGVRLIKC